MRDLQARGDRTLASSTNKKVQVQRFDREPIAGFVNPATFLTPDGIELLQVTGTVAVLPYADVKLVAFVRDFPASDAPPARRTFVSRPKIDGLWVRLRFRDGDELEGLMRNDLLGVEPAGFDLIPPDGAQRMFVPRAAVRDAQVLGVVGSPLRMKRTKPSPKEQIGLFEEPR
jgi:hypothetical protein